MPRLAKSARARAKSSGSSSRGTCSRTWWRSSGARAADGTFLARSPSMPPGFVYVIDSPTPFDLLNGQTEGQDVCDELELSEIAHAYHLAADKEMLEIILRLRIATEVKRRGLPPTLL